MVQPGADGEPAGYALYAVTDDWDEEGPKGEIRVRELMAATPEARAGLWRYLLGLDLMRSLTWWLAPDQDPLPHLLRNADAVSTRIGSHGLWVRLVDAPAALTARAYSAPFSLVLEIGDPLCPWNAGRFRLEAEDGGATCEPTGDAPDLTLEIEALGAAYLGGTPLDALAGAGRVQERTPGALRTASAAFRGFPEPWCPEIF